MTPARTLLLCADDFGLSRAIDNGILALAAQGRLGAVSCIVNAEGWPSSLAALQATGVAVGLHLNLTEGRPLSAALQRHWPQLPPLPRLIAQAHLGALPRAALRDELQAQFSAFTQAAGHAPAHLDGHQHVHHLPGVRALVLEALAAWPGLGVRNTALVQGPGFAVKRALIAGTGGRALGRALGRTGRAQNQQLRGVYDFQDADYRRLMQGWLHDLPAAGTLLFCHPGHAQPPDPIGAARERELRYLASPEFADDLAQAGVTLTRPAGGELRPRTTSAG